MTLNGSTPRRGFLGRMAAAVMAAGIPWRRVEARSAGAAQQAGPGDWLEGLNGTYRCLFDSPLHGDGFPLVQMRNYIRTHEQTYQTPPSEVNMVGTLYFTGPQSSQPLAFTDAMWEKYGFGEFMGLTDARTGRPLTRNIFYRPQPGDPIPGGESSGIEMLQGRGATFLTCDNSLGGFSRRLASPTTGNSSGSRRDRSVTG